MTQVAKLRSSNGLSFMQVFEALRSDLEVFLWPGWTYGAHGPAAGCVADGHRLRPLA